MNKIFVLLIFTVLLCSCSSGNTEINNSEQLNTSENVCSEQTVKKAPELIAEIEKDAVTISDYTEIDISQLNVLGLETECFYGDDLFVTYPAENDMLEFCRINTKTGDITNISSVDWSARYNFTSCFTGNRYLSFITNKNAEKGYTATIHTYDIKNDILIESKQFQTKNIVQYITSTGNDSIAYFYYEYETSDWVLMSYNFSTKKSQELYRFSPQADYDYSPTGLGFNGGNLILTVQTASYKEKSDIETIFINIGLDGQEISRSSFFDFPISEIANIKYFNDVYYFLGKEYRASAYNTMFAAKIEDSEIMEVIPANYGLSSLISVNSNNQSRTVFRCANGNDFAEVSPSDSKIQFFNISIENFPNIDTAILNEKNDLAVIKSNIDYSEQKLVIIPNDKIT